MIEAGKSNALGRRVQRMRLVVVLTVVLSATSCGWLDQPILECEAAPGCEQALAAAQDLLAKEKERTGSTRTPERLTAYPTGASWQVIACWSDGAHRLIDVTGVEEGSAQASFNFAVVGGGPCDGAVPAPGVP